jgi:hypothetical protein
MHALTLTGLPLAGVGVDRRWRSVLHSSLRTRFKARRNIRLTDAEILSVATHQDPATIVTISARPSR